MGLPHASMRGFVLLLLVHLGCAGASAVHADARSGEWSGVARIVAVGDIHGDFDRFTAVLKDAGIIDDRLQWSGRDSHLVQLGDIPDRGPDSRKVMDLVMKLERQAKRAGGYVHALIGNHESMAFQGDNRYVHPGQYAAFVDKNSLRRQDAHFKAVVEQLKANLPAEQLPLFDAEYERKWREQFPLGYVERTIAWSPRGKYGAWVIDHQAIIRINDTLFTHGGLSPAYASSSLASINDKVREELKQGKRLGEEAVINQDEGPLWYRGLATGEETCANYEALLNTLAAREAARIVVGHTPLAGAVLPRFNNRVFLADVGLSSYYGGAKSALVIEGDALYALHEGHLIRIPARRDEYLAQLQPFSSTSTLLTRFLEEAATLTEPDWSCPPPAAVAPTNSGTDR